jgi:hypothetical protein
MGMRFWLSGPRLPFGFRAGISVPVGRGGSQRRSAPPAPTDGPTISYVYVIAGHQGTVKVGYSTNPRMRLAALQTASPGPLEMVHVLATDIDGRMIEAEVHRILDRHRLAGEWFDVSPEVAIEAVGRAAKNMGLPVIETDSGQIANAVRNGGATVSDLGGPGFTAPAYLRFFYGLFVFLGVFMLFLGAIEAWSGNKSDVGTNILTGTILAAVCFLLAAIPKKSILRWKAQRINPAPTVAAYPVPVRRGRFEDAYRLK